MSVRLELLALLDFVDAYFYDAVPKTEIRRRLAPIIDHLDEADGDWLDNDEDVNRGETV